MQSADHGIYESSILKAAAPTGIKTYVGCAGHMLDAAGQDNIGHSGFDHGCAAEDGFHARNTYAIHGYSGHRFRNTG